MHQKKLGKLCVKRLIIKIIDKITEKNKCAFKQ